MRNSSTTPETRTGRPPGFALLELLVILTIVALFAAVTVPALLSAREPVSRAQCVNNLRQIAVGWSMYREQFNQVMPCHWPGYTDTQYPSNPWRTYEVYRVVPGTSQIAIGDGTLFDTPSGPWNWALLSATGLLPNPRVFYCPSTARNRSSFTYDYYATATNGWPSTPVGSGDNKVRTGYNYYPQLRATELISGHRVPVPPVPPTRWTELDSKKSIATDLVLSANYQSHQASGFVMGVNALFPSGAVVFQDARSNPSAFNPAIWGDTTVSSDYIANNPNNFRYIMSLWKP
jgi:type II secretory pathway pseudopilin PulG